ncbi:hypothetical protein BD408DRAFT_457997, partial [Parasitella parasitica]
LKSDVENKEVLNATILDTFARAKVKAILHSFPNNYKFEKYSTFHDIKPNPECHYKAFMKIFEIFDSEELRQFSCYSIRTTFIPCGVWVETGESYSKQKATKTSKTNCKQRNKCQCWGSGININNKAFKNQGINKSLHFQDTMVTDGVDVSLIKKITLTDRKAKSATIQDKA